MRADAQAHAGQSLGALDPSREGLIEMMGLRTSLGTEAEHILAVTAAAEGAADVKAPLAPAFGTPTSVVQDGRIIDAVAIIASLPAYPPPLYEARDYLKSTLDFIGRAGSNTAHEDTGTSSASATDGGVASSTEVRTTADVVINGSDVRAVFDRSVHTVATDTTTGSTLLDQSVTYHVYAEIDVCPSAAGIVAASSGHAYSSESSTFAGAGGRVGSHATASVTSDSTFEGHVDDQANLGNVSQDSKQDGKFKRTASADGGPEASHEGTYTTSESGIGDGVPTAHDWSVTGSDWSNLSSISADRTGDATNDMLFNAAGSAAVDYTTIDKSFVEAQRLWRDRRCVIVTAPSYIPASAFANNANPTHSEDVEAGSTTKFEVGTGHRFDQKVTALIKAELNGKDTLDPREVPKPPGTLTYVAGDEDGQDASVTLVSTSKQGIGRLVLQFHTGGEKLKVSIDGTMTTSGFGVSYSTALSVHDIVLTRQSDGSYLGSGPTTAKITLNGDVPCPTPFKEQGTVTLRASHPAAADPNAPSPWTVTYRQRQQDRGLGDVPRHQPRPDAAARPERGDRRVHVRARRRPDRRRRRHGQGEEDRGGRGVPERHHRHRQGRDHQGVQPLVE